MFWLFPPMFFSPPNLLQIHGPPLAQVFYLWVNPCAHTCPHQSMTFGWEKAGAVWEGHPPWAGGSSGSLLGQGWGLAGPSSVDSKEPGRKPSFPLVVKPSECSSEGWVSGWGELSEIGWLLPCVSLWDGTEPIAVSVCWVNKSQPVLSE